MPTAKARIQVTIDDELGLALDAVDPAPASRSRLVRDLALRGSEVIRAERGQAEDALRTLTEIADGTRDHDMSASAAALRSRGDRLPS